MTKQEKIERNNKIIAEYINTPNNLKSIKNLSSRFNLGINTISKILKDSGIKIYNTSQHTCVDEEVFNTIDTEEKAYWLGFMYADGCIHSKENRVELSLKGNDIQHLYKFAKFLNVQNNKNFVKYYNPTKSRPYDRCRIMFRSNKVWSDLNKKGCMPNKSLILKFPDRSVFSNNDLIRHFIRGYVDGDGCLCITKNKCILNILGTEEFLKELMAELPLSREYPVYKRNKTSDTNFCTFNLWNSTALNVLIFLYKDASIYLDRKYEKFKEICRLYEKSYK